MANMANLEWTPIGGQNLVYGVLNGVLHLLPTLQSKHVSEKTDESRRILDQARSLCGARIPVSEWEPTLCSGFLHIACRPARAELLALKDAGMSDAERSAGLGKIIQYCDVLCSILAEIGPALTLQSKQEVVALWAMAHLTDGAGAESLGGFIYPAAEALAPTTLSREDLLRQLTLQCVLHVAPLIQSGAQPLAYSDIVTARAWCGDLLGLPGMPAQLVVPLKRAAGILGVPIPVDVADGNGGAPVVVDEARIADVIDKIVAILRQRGGICKFTALGDEFKRRHNQRVPEATGMQLNDFLARAEQDGLLERWGEHPNQYACLPGLAPPDEAEQGAEAMPETPPGETTDPSAEPGITSDPRYRDVLRSSDAMTLREFIATEKDHLEALLIGRLGVHLDTDHLLMPNGRIEVSRAGERQEHTLSMAAANALSMGNWGQAARLYWQIEQELRANLPAYVSTSQALSICQNFRAYALAKDGDVLNARGILDRLTDSDVTRTSVYWNLACCILPRDPEFARDKLDVLAHGLDNAPHPLLLAGAVSLAIQHHIDDPRLPTWLSAITISEALLLAFEKTVDTLSRSERDTAMRRLLDYAQHGDPPKPPSMDRRPTDNDLREYMDRLTLQPAAAMFWFTCRERFDRQYSGYWQAKCDFLERQQRLPEAAETFCDELRCRLNALSRGERQNGNSSFVVRRRAEVWLERCRRNDLLGDIGQRIFNIFYETYSGSGLPRELLAEVLPTDQRIIDRFYPGSRGVPASPESLERRGEGDARGTTAIFLDILNLIRPNQEPIIANLNTGGGDDPYLPGRYKLETVLGVLDEYVGIHVGVPVVERWAVDFHLRDSVRQVCTDKGYQLIRVPDDITKPDTDDKYLAQGINDILREQSSAHHFVILTGDKDHLAVVTSLLKAGKNVYVISRKEAAASQYPALAGEHPGRMTFMTVEALMEGAWREAHRRTATG